MRYIDTEFNSWRRVIFPYVKSTQIFECPSNTGNNVLAGDSNGTGYPAGTPLFHQSYCINGMDNITTGNTIARRTGGTPDVPAPASLSAVPDSSRTLLVGESRAGFSELVPYYGFQGHLQTCNFLFADGHVKALKPISTIQGTNMWTIEDEPDATTVSSFLQSWVGYATQGGTPAAPQFEGWERLVDRN